MRSPLLLVCLLPLAACLHTQVRTAERDALMAPNDSAAWVALADAYDKAGRDKRAAEAYARALSLDPENATAREALHDRPSRGLRSAERATLRDPTNDEAWGDLGDAQKLAGLQQNALESYMHALSIDPQDSEWQQRVSELAGPEQMITIAEGLLGSAMTDDESLGDLGDMYKNAGRTDEACEMYRRALQIDSADTEWQQAVGQCDGGYGYGDYGEAVPEEYYGDAVIGMVGSEYLGTVGTLGGVEATDAKTLGIEAAKSGNKGQAMNGLWSALLAEPTDQQIRMLYVAVSGKSEVEVLEKLTEHHTDADELWGELGDARLGAGDRSGALAAYQRALSIDASDEEWLAAVAVLQNTSQ